MACPAFCGVWWGVVITGILHSAASFLTCPASGWSAVVLRTFHHTLWLIRQHAFHQAKTAAVTSAVFRHQVTDQSPLLIWLAWSITVEENLRLRAGQWQL